jgi:DNA replication protein DnaC
LVTALSSEAVTRHGKRVHFYSTVKLVKRQEQEKAAGRAGRLAHQLMHLDIVILDELGYLLSSQSVGALLFHLLSKLYEHTSVIIMANSRLRRVGERLRRSEPHVGRPIVRCGTSKRVQRNRHQTVTQNRQPLRSTNSAQFPFGRWMRWSRDRRSFP